MKYIEIQPAEAITTRDFPVHSEEVLKRYFEMYQNGIGSELPPVPLICVKRFHPHFEKQERELLELFLSQNPDVKYFLLNGSHRTTSATLTRNKIRGMVLESIEDIIEASQITFRGNEYGHMIQNTIEANIEDLVSHFKGTTFFETIQQKTDRMIASNVLTLTLEKS